MSSADPFGAIGGALVGGAIGFGTSAYGQYAAAKEAKRNRKWQEYMYRNRYQFTREDLESAGYNPILALRQGPGSPGSGAVGQTPDYGGNTVRGIAAANLDLVRAQAQETKARATGIELDNQEKRPRAAVGEGVGDMLDQVKPLLSDVAGVIKAYDGATTADALDDAEAKAAALKSRLFRLAKGTVWEFLVPEHTKFTIEWLRQFYRGVMEEAEIQERMKRENAPGYDAYRNEPLVITPKETKR